MFSAGLLLHIYSSLHAGQAVLSIAAGVVGTQAWRSKLIYKLAITKRLSDKELEAEIKEREKAKKKTDGGESDEEEEHLGRIRSE